jgi:ABC-2 type transport system permease protein
MSIIEALGDGAVVTKRNLIKMRRVPDVVIFSTIQPIMFVLLFVYVFGSAISVPGVDYRDFLMGGIFAQTIVFGSAMTGVGLADDLQKGIIDRFRSLPMARSAVLVGRTTSDLLNNLIVLVVMAVVGLAVGWRVNTSFLAGLAGFAVLLFFGYAMSWISATIGLMVRSVEVAQSAGFIWLFPLTFLSNVFVDPDTLPGPLEAFVDASPISILTTAARGLMEGDAAAGDIGVVLAVSAGLTLVFLPITTRLYRRG